MVLLRALRVYMSKLAIRELGAAQQEERLRAELEGLRPSARRKRAAAAGAPEAALEAAEDAAVPKEAMVALVLAHEVDPHARR